MTTEKSSASASQQQPANNRAAESAQVQQNYNLHIRNLFQRLHPALYLEDASIFVLLAILGAPEANIICMMNDAAKLTIRQGHTVVTLEEVKSARHMMMMKKLNGVPIWL